MTHKNSALASCLLLFLVLSACGSDSPRNLRCEYSAELVAEGRACVEDDDCPCGSGCNIGACSALCDSNANCESGERCNEFGRCAPANGALIQAPSPGGASEKLVISQAVLESLDGAGPQRFTIYAPEGGDSSTLVRMVPETGLGIHCAPVGEGDPASATAAPCEVAVGTGLEVVVVPTSTLAGGTALDVGVFWSAERENVTYSFPLTSSSFEAEGAPTGFYEGIASLTTVGSGLVPDSAATPSSLAGSSGGVPAGVEIEVPVSVEIFDGGGPLLVRLHDPFGALSPTHVVEASLEDDGSGGMEWNADSLAYIETAFRTSADDSGDGFEELKARFGYRAESGGAPTGETVWPILSRADLDAGIFKIELPVYFDNNSHPQRAPAAVWTLALTRSAAVDVSSTAPVAPSGDAEIHDRALALDTRLTPSRWETGMTQQVLDPAGFVKSAIVGAFHDQSQPEDASIATCTNIRSLSAGDRADYLLEVGSRFAAALLLGTAEASFVGGAARSTEVVRGRDFATSSNAENIAASYLANVISRGINFVVGGQNLPLHTIDYDISISVPPRVVNIATGGSPVQRIEIPCGFNISGSVVNPSGPLIGFFGSGNADCDRVAAEFGCRSRVLQINERYLGSGQVHRFETSGQSFQNLNRNWAVGLNVVEVTGVCTMPEVASECTELMQCHSGEVGDALRSTSLAANFFSESGDAVCQGSYRSLGLDADDNVAELNAGNLFAACVSELETIGDPITVGDNLFDALSESKCMNFARMLSALGASSDSLRLQDIADYPWPRKAGDQALAQRLLTRWVDVHGYIANEMAQQQVLASALRRAPVSGATPPPPLEDVLSITLAGWDLLLHPRFASVLDNMPGELLAAPDYRLIRFGGALPPDVADDPAHGLPEVMLDTLRSQVVLVSHALERAAFRGDRSAVELMAPVLRYSAVIAGMAEELTARATAACVANDTVCNGGTTPLWFAQYGRARNRADIAMKRMLALANALNEGANPFGIEDSDVPLYFADESDTDAGRFFAISDYFVGSSPEDVGAWAPPLINDAELYLDSVRNRWVERQDREVQTDRDQIARQTRIVNAQVDYGERLLNLCGRPGAILPGDVLTSWEEHHGRPFDSANCFIEQSNPICRQDPAASLDLFSDAEAQYSVCFFREISRLAGDGAEYSDPALTEFAKACPGTDTSYIESGCGGSALGACLRCSDAGVPDAPVPGGDFLEVNTPAGIDFGLVRLARDTCRANVPDAVVPLPAMSDKVGDLPTSCFRGAIGEQAAALRSVATEIGIARAELAEMSDAFGLAVDACASAKATGESLIELQEALNKEKTTLRTVKLAADIAANVAGGVKDCGAAAGSDNKGGSVAACAGAAVEAAAKSVSDGMEFAINELDSKFELDTLNTEVAGAFELCSIEAKQYKVGVRSQGLRIQQAIQDLETAAVARQGLVVEADTWYEDGLATVSFEEERRVSPMSQDLWIDEPLRDWERSFRLAHRVTYLSVLAVEYEFQQSLGLREEVLAAEVPADLRAALQELRTLTGPRSVFGSRPTSRKVILSLRDDLLALADYSDASPQEQNLTSIERLQLRLASPSNARYAEDGSYLGQEIEFSVAPGGEGFGAFGDQQITSQNSCAERLWSINASIQGGEELIFEDESTFTDITVKKANTFFSQWCDKDTKEFEFQVVSVRPERNLFRDPENAGASFIDAQLGGLRDSNTSKALIQPALNVPRDEFENDAFENGESSQLAGRGLFGQYSIFFPAQAISVLQSGEQSAGLDLSKVEDVLLRFDYVSAAR